MNWKQYKTFFKKNKIQEPHFILGIDLGNCTSSIAYFDTLNVKPEIMDISGGYGKAAAPTALQYVNDTKEWIFGEYAILNVGGENKLLLDLLKNLDSEKYIELNQDLDIAEPINKIFSIYISELILNCKNINPKAEIVGIVVTTNILNKKSHQSLLQAFDFSGYGSVLIDFKEHSECVLTYYLHNFHQDKINENVMLLDFGDGGLRSTIYNIKYDDIYSASCLVYITEHSIGTGYLDEAIYKLFADAYCKNYNLSYNSLDYATKEQLTAFTYQHKDILFQKKIDIHSQKSTRLYFNFSYPPFYMDVSMQNLEDLLEPFKRKANLFFEDTLKKAGLNNIDKIILTGGGFDFLWAKALVSGFFKNTNIILQKNTKAIPSLGASLIAAKSLGIINYKDIHISDMHKIPFDIGIMVQIESKEAFLPIIQKGSFLWQKTKPVYFILKDDNLDGVIDFFKRDDLGNLSSIFKLNLKNIPNKPSNTLRICITIVAKSIYEYAISIEDAGFGEIAPKTSYREEKQLNIK